MVTVLETEQVINIAVRENTQTPHGGRVYYPEYLHKSLNYSVVPGEGNRN